MPTQDRDQPERDSVMQSILFWIVGKLGALVLRTLMCTVRVQGHPASRPPALPGDAASVVYSIWHHSLLVFIYRYRNQGAYTIVSEHRDGEYIARIAQEMGFQTARGSSTRGGGRALIRLRRAARAGHDVGVTVDGPRGPRETAQLGAIFLAQITGLPIVPAIVGLSRFWEVPSWDRFRIPKPFAKGLVGLGEPIAVPRDVPADELEPYRKQLEEAMRALQAELDEQMSPRSEKAEPA